MHVQAHLKITPQKREHFYSPIHYSKWELFFFPIPNSYTKQAYGYYNLTRLSVGVVAASHKEHEYHQVPQDNSNGNQDIWNTHCGCPYIWFQKLKNFHKNWLCDYNGLKYRMYT